MIPTDADIYRVFTAVPMAGRRYGAWHISRDVLDGIARRHQIGCPRLLLGCPIREVDGVDVITFVPRYQPPPARHRKLRLR